MSVGQVSTPSTREGYSSEDYEIGIICALPIELAAVLGMLDEEHPRLPQNPNDSNLYYLGRTGDHNIVITCLPAGRIGLVSAARVAMQMQISFACIQKGLMVGIGGGVPSEQHDIRLGDIVVSQPTGQYGGVVQYDFGKTHPGGVFERTGSLCPPPDVLLAALNGVKVSQLTNRFSIAAHLSSLAERSPDYKFPSQLSDDLYHPDHLHKGGQSCCGCGTENRIQREPRSNRLLPVVHYGTIASGDRVMKDAIERDKISQSLGGILCFEMEAAALMNNFRCLVIRGISDYSDSHKNDGWQKYAAAVAAAYAKELLNHLPPAQPSLIHSIPRDADSEHQRLNRTTDQEILNWLSSSRVAMIQGMTRNDRVKNSGEWLLHDSRYKDWFYSGGLIWLHGTPGCGKSFLSSKIIDDLTERYKSYSNFRVVYWYFRFSDASTQGISYMLRSILRQLICLPLPDKVRKLWEHHHRCGSEPSRNELLNMIMDLISVHENVFLVFDALDEYPKEGSPPKSSLLETIEQLLNTHQKHPHIVVTSRREPDIREALQSVARHSIDVDRALKGDVEKLVDHALSHESIKRWGPKLMSLAVDRLLHCEERQFRWTDLQIKRLRVCPTADEFRETLNTIPGALEKSYHLALETIPEDHQEDVRWILMWLTSSFRELTSSEVAAVVGFPFFEDVFRICPSVLFTVSDEGTRKTIKLAHFTVKEFLIVQEGHEMGLHWYNFTARMANRCVTAQAIDFVFQSPPAESRDILGYASQFWPAHARRLNAFPDSTDDDELRSRINSLLEVSNRNHLLDWLMPQYPINAPVSKSAGLSLQPLYYASLLGIKGSVMHFWKGCFQLNQEEGFHGNALMAAACMGHTEVVTWLTDQVEDPSEYICLSRIVRYVQVNVAETLRVLPRKGPRQAISKEVMHAMASNSAGAEIIYVLLTEDLASITITEELVQAAVHNKLNPGVIEVLVKIRAHEIPISFLTLLAIGRRSTLALQSLVNSPEYMELDMDPILTQPECFYATKELIDLGLQIPLDTTLIKILAGSPNGTQMMKLLLETQVMEHPLTALDAIIVAKNFDLETLDLLLKHGKNDEDFVRAWKEARGVFHLIY